MGGPGDISCDAEALTCPGPTVWRPAKATHAEFSTWPVDEGFSTNYDAPGNYMLQDLIPALRSKGREGCFYFPVQNVIIDGIVSGGTKGTKGGQTGE